jgi:SAM-dependent methyltransferase
MTNIFDQYPEFISTDPRIHRKNSNAGSYEINSNFQYQRHKAMLPADAVTGKRVLDLGSCVGASGAWALANGAERYVGVELQKKFCDVAKENLSNRFPDADWEIREESFTDFFANLTEKFDIVIAFGVLYQNIYFETLVNHILSVDPMLVLIESTRPPFLQKLKEQLEGSALKQLMHLPLVEYGNYHMVSEIEKYTVAIESAFPSLPALKVIMAANGFELVNDAVENLIRMYPDTFAGRYSGIFKRTNHLDYTKGFETVYNTPDEQVLQPFNSNQPWEFNSSVAAQFDRHARQHIPDYARVIAKSVDICKKFIKDSNSARIIDVGCAVGETIKKLHEGGFHNLVGVDSSLDMLNKAKHSTTADWVKSNDFPLDQGPYNAVLCNWTLHFIKDKIAYLQDIYTGLLPGGFLVISDKTADSGIDLELYHDFKRQQGVSEKEIAEKAASVANVMFINNANWYVDTLTDLGFESVSIINAAPCFTTFLAKKKPA